MKRQLKILIVEDGEYYIFGKALKDAFIKKGYKKTELFSFCELLSENNTVYKKVQNKLCIGLEIRRINKFLVKKCAAYKPDLVFLYRCRIIFPLTVKRIKSMGSTVFSYNNDNPFSDYYPIYYWRHYRNSIKYDDATFVFRKSNIDECLQKGACNVELLRSYYIDNRNYPLYLEERDKIYDVVFLGHYEKDDRVRYLSALTAAGITIGIPKGGWTGIEEGNRFFKRLENTRENYNQILNESKIALVFLSSLNKDTYTQRCFEIPATRTFMLSVYTDDLAGMFKPDKEAVYFKTPEELVQKAKYYLEHEDEREQIARAGYERLKHDGHEIGDRVQQIMDKYYEVINK